MTRSLFALLLALSALWPVVACATTGVGPKPASLFQEAVAASQQGEFDAAYTRLRQLATEFPGSPEAAKAFPLAAGIVKQEYFRHRLTDPSSRWVTSEPQFMFSWLARYYVDGFPAEQVNALLRGFPVPVFQEFEAYAQTRPELARFRLHAERDNGLVIDVTGEPIGS